MRYTTENITNSKINMPLGTKNKYWNSMLIDAPQTNIEINKFKAPF